MLDQGFQGWYTTTELAAACQPQLNENSTKHLYHGWYGGTCGLYT
jgi:hypothetical protein